MQDKLREYLKLLIKYSKFEKKSYCKDNPYFNRLELLSIQLNLLGINTDIYNTKRMYSCWI